MWFKHLVIYRIKTWNLNAQTLQTQLARMALQPCGGLDMQSRGWIAPKPEDESLVHACGPQQLICLGVEKKLLPASVIAQFTRVRAAEIETQQGYQPGRKQMKDIRQEVTDSLLPRAFSVKRRTSVWIDPVDGWMAIDAANIGKADEVIEMLHKTLDGIAFAPLHNTLSPVAAMTGWLSGTALPANFTIDQDCELRSRGDAGASVRYVRHSPDEMEIRRHIQGGKEVTRLALTWADRIAFVLHENLQVKRLSPLDLIKEEAADQDQDDSFDADFALMTGELRKLIPALIDLLGGAAATAAG